MPTKPCRGVIIGIDGSGEQKLNGAAREAESLAAFLSLRNVVGSELRVVTDVDPGGEMLPTKENVIDSLKWCCEIEGNSDSENILVAIIAASVNDGIVACDGKHITNIEIQNILKKSKLPTLCLFDTTPAAIILSLPYTMPHSLGNYNKDDACLFGSNIVVLSSVPAPENDDDDSTRGGIVSSGLITTLRAHGATTPSNAGLLASLKLNFSDGRWKRIPTLSSNCPISTTDHFSFGMYESYRKPSLLRDLTPVQILTQSPITSSNHFDDINRTSMSRVKPIREIRSSVLLEKETNPTPASHPAPISQCNSGSVDFINSNYFKEETNRDIPQKNWSVPTKISSLPPVHPAVGYLPPTRSGTADSGMSSAGSIEAPAKSSPVRRKGKKTSDSAISNLSNNSSIRSQSLSSAKTEPSRSRSRSAEVRSASTRSSSPSFACASQNATNPAAFESRYAEEVRRHFPREAFDDEDSYPVPCRSTGISPPPPAVASVMIPTGIPSSVKNNEEFSPQPVITKPTTDASSPPPNPSSLKSVYPSCSPVDMSCPPIGGVPPGGSPTAASGPIPSRFSVLCSTANVHYNSEHLIGKKTTAVETHDGNLQNPDPPQVSRSLTPQDGLDPVRDEKLVQGLQFSPERERPCNNRNDFRGWGDGSTSPPSPPLADLSSNKPTRGKNTLHKTQSKRVTSPAASNRWRAGVGSGATNKENNPTMKAKPPVAVRKSTPPRTRGRDVTSAGMSYRTSSREGNSITGVPTVKRVRSTSRQLPAVAKESLGSPQSIKEPAPRRLSGLPHPVTPPANNNGKNSPPRTRKKAVEQLSFANPSTCLLQDLLSPLSVLGPQMHTAYCELLTWIDENKDNPALSSPGPTLLNLLSKRDAERWEWKANTQQLINNMLGSNGNVHFKGEMLKKATKLLDNDRVVVTGTKDSGKSTLLRMLVVDVLLNDLVKKHEGGKSFSSTFIVPLSFEKIVPKQTEVAGGSTISSFFQTFFVNIITATIEALLSQRPIMRQWKAPIHLFWRRVLSSVPSLPKQFAEIFPILAYTWHKEALQCHNLFSSGSYQALLSHVMGLVVSGFGVPCEFEKTWVIIDQLQPLLDSGLVNQVGFAPVGCLLPALAQHGSSAGFIVACAESAVPILSKRVSQIQQFPICDLIETSLLPNWLPTVIKCEGRTFNISVFGGCPGYLSSFVAMLGGPPEEDDLESDNEIEFYSKEVLQLLTNLETLHSK